jgi:hypothetical protein
MRYQCIFAVGHEGTCRDGRGNEWGGVSVSVDAAGDITIDAVDEVSVDVELSQPEKKKKRRKKE